MHEVGKFVPQYINLIILFGIRRNSQSSSNYQSLSLKIYVYPIVVRAKLI
jgi:hypothetical protein